MALPPLAPVSELEIALELDEGSLDGAPLARVEQALRRASALVRAEAGRDWVDPDGVTITAPDEVISVVVEVVARVYRNPDGFSGESVGDYSYQYPQGDTPSGLALSDDEKRTVRRAAQGRVVPFSGTVRTPSAFADPGLVDPALYFWGLE